MFSGFSCGTDLRVSVLAAQRAVLALVLGVELAGLLPIAEAQALASRPRQRVLTRRNAASEPDLESLFWRTFDLADPAAAVLGAVAGDATLEARLGLSPEDLEAVSTLWRPLQDMVIVNGAQGHQGIEIDQATMRFRFEHSTGRLLALSFVDLGGLQFASSRPAVSAAAAETWLRGRPEAFTLRDEPALLYLWDQEALLFRLAWRLEADAGNIHDSRIFFIDAHDGTLLREKAVVFGLDATGTVSGYSTDLSTNLPDYPGNPPVEQAVGFLRVTAEPGGLSGTTDAGGNFVLETSTSPITVTAVVDRGTYVNAVLDTPRTIGQGTGLTGITIELNADPDDPDRARYTAQLNTWQGVLWMRNFIDPVYARTGVELLPGVTGCPFYPPPPERTRWLVDLWPNYPTQGECHGNAFWTDFYCPAQIGLWPEVEHTHNVGFASPILHELGHHFAMEMTSKGSTGFDRAHAESLADIFAAFALGTPVIGRGWEKGEEATSYIRDVDTCQAVGDPCEDPSVYEDFSIWPADQTAYPIKPHKKGLPYSGSWWDLRERLINDDPAGGQQVAEDLFVLYYDAYFLTSLPNLTYAIAEELLVVDDTPYFGGDNCIENGSPHEAAIKDSFAAHNLHLRPFKRGDTNSNGTVDFNDYAHLFRWLFVGGVTIDCLDTADANDDGTINLTDAVVIRDWWAYGGPPPAPPGPFNCGTDEATWEDRITCEKYTPCETAGGCP